MPTSTRFAPVMLASAGVHGFSPSGFGTQAPASANSCPAWKLNTKSTAYSGSTASSASTARASPALMSSWAASAAQASTNAAPTMAAP